MSWKSKLVVLAAAGSIIAGASAATADEVQIVHDKPFWSEALQAVTAAGTEAIGNEFVEAAYGNAEQYKAFIQSSVAAGVHLRLDLYGRGCVGPCSTLLLVVVRIVTG